MMIGLWSIKREMGDEDKNTVEGTSRYERSQVQLA
jgi:hypothetical protein